MPPETSRPNLTIGEQTEEQRAAEQARQDEIDAATGVEDGDIETGTGADEPAPRAELEPGERRVVQKSPADEARDAIAKRFRREGGDVPFDGDMTNPENLYGEVARVALEPDPDAPEPGVPVEDNKPAPRMITRKVRGKDVTRSEDEWLELASKVEAADSYLEESRALLEDAKTIKAERAGRDRQHPDGQSSTQDDGQDNPDATDQTRHPGTDLESVVEQIQFGDPKDAAKALAQAIDAAAAKQADDGHLKRLMSNDLARSQKALQTFTAANPELANDELASVAIENTLYKIFREEILAQGVDADKIPSNPKQLADWHRFYRVNGAPVSTAADALEKAKERFVAWRGPASQTKPAAKPQGAPRVVVNVERNERRAAIPTQPNRAAAPRRDAPPPKVTTRSDVIANMRKQRGQL